MRLRTRVGLIQASDMSKKRQVNSPAARGRALHRALVERLERHLDFQGTVDLGDALESVLVRSRTSNRMIS